MGSKASGVFFGAVALALLSLSGAAFYASADKHYSPVAESAAAAPAGPGPAAAATSSFSLITEPDDGIAPLERMIESASSSIDLVMYEFEDPQLEKLLANEAAEGIAVRVILDNGYYGEGSSANEQAFDYLRSNGVSVRWSPAHFALTHEKALVVDGSKALVMTFNFSPQYYASDRDFGVVDGDPNDVAAIERAFDSDWNGENSSAQDADDLVWSPGSRAQILALINAARTSLDVYNEEMEDPQIIQALAGAAKRGVDVEIDMTDENEWGSAFQTLVDAGAHVRTYAASAPLYIHAKVVIADGAQAFVGSENFSTTSLEQNRELGLVLSDPAVVSSLSRTFVNDWRNAAPFPAGK